MSSTVAAVRSETPAQRAAFFSVKATDFAQRAQASHSDAGRAYNEAQAAKYLRFAATAAQRATVEAPVEVKAPAAPARTEEDACRVRVMRRFFAVAKAAGLSLKFGDCDAMKLALGKYLGCRVISRRDLSAGHWAEAAAAVELGILFW